MPNIGGILMAAAGLGFVIFVHELGHFAVARMCGVKCEKFMVGFDFGGLKLSRKWGETEYGIGIFPLGGYVQMFGQNDDPSKYAEQLDASQVAADSEFAKEIVGPDGKKRMVDRRSYQAKSVPQRMAIISAGVVMNMIFAFIFAVVAFGLGVKYTPCVVSQTTPGAPAWEAGLMPGDEIVQIGDRREPGFVHLRYDVSLGDLENGINLVVHRAASDTEEQLVLKPRKSTGMAQIGVSPPLSTKVADQKRFDHFSNTRVLPPLEPGDEILALGGQKVTTHGEIAAYLVAHPSEPIELLVRRPMQDDEDAIEEVGVTLDPLPARQMGLVMTMGSIASVQKNSPAEAAGLNAGDQIVAIDGQTIGTDQSGEPSLDPGTLNGLFGPATTSVTLSVRRADSDPNAELEQVTLTPRAVTWPEESRFPGSPMSIPALGIAYQIQPVVGAVVTGGPSATAGIKPRDRITSVTLIVPDEDGGEPKHEKPIKLDEDNANWPLVLSLVGEMKAGVKVLFKIQRGKEEIEATISPEPAEDVYVVDRNLGLVLRAFEREREVHSFSEQVAYGWDRTVYSLTTVVRILQKLMSSQVPANQLGGPLMILTASYSIASSGLPAFLLFLTLLSANLAVLNFLPIPVLDGGHMVFLAWEGITGKPAPEKLVMTLHLIGFALLLGLMIFVTRNDIINLFM